MLRPEFGNESVYMSDPTGNFNAGDQRGNSEKMTGTHTLE